MHFFGNGNVRPRSREATRSVDAGRVAKRNSNSARTAKSPPLGPTMTDGVSSFIMSDYINLSDSRNQINYSYCDVSHTVSYRANINTRTLYPGQYFKLAEVHVPRVPMHDVSCSRVS